MSSSSELWKKFRAAQVVKNVDAANAYREAIQRVEKGKDKDADWWEQQGDVVMNDDVPKETPKEHATR